MVGQVLSTHTSNNAALHREHSGLEWLTIVIVAKGQGLDMSDDSDDIIASRVPSEIRPFSPDHLVAGGSADMSLWIAKGIIEQHGGRIHMFSGAGPHDSGCHFIVELPLYSHTHPIKDPRGDRGASSAVSSLHMWASGRSEAPSPGGASTRQELRRVSEDKFADTPKEKRGTVGGSLFNRGVGYLRRMSTDHINQGGNPGNVNRSKVVPIAEDDTPSYRARLVLNAPSGRGSQDLDLISRDSLNSTLLAPAYPHITSMEPAYRQVRAPPIGPLLTTPNSSTNVDLLDRTTGPTTDQGRDNPTNTPSAVLSLQLPSSSSTHSHQPRGLQSVVAMMKKKMMLVVDDSDLTRKMLCRIVRAQGFDVEEADDGDVAVQMVQRRLETIAGQPQRTAGVGQEGVYECILMDFIMPRLDGPSATKEIRDLGFTGLVLGVTGNGQEFDVKHFKHMGANEVFTKPLDVTRLKEYLRLHNIIAK